MPILACLLIGTATLSAATRDVIPADAEVTSQGKPRGECPESEIQIQIQTDDYPGETTWEVVEYPSLTVVGSGGPYEEPGLYDEYVCVPDAGCYHFVIYDSYGDGICCDYGEGYYSVYHNDTLVGSGGVFGYEEWTPCIGNCPPECGLGGACCVGEVCYEVENQAECDALGGEYMGPGTTCDPNPCLPPYEPECPEDTIWGQEAMNCDDQWSAASSGVFPGGETNYLVYESFSGLPCEVCGVRWWGLVLRYYVGWYPCSAPLDLYYDIKFYQDDEGLPGAEMYAYTYLSPSATEVDQCGVYPFVEFQVDLDPCCYELTDGWISIQSQEDVTNECVFLWFSSTYGDGDSLQEDVIAGTMSSTDYDRGVCLSGPCWNEPGACCLPDGSCVDAVVPAACADIFGLYMGAGTECATVTCPPPHVPECPVDKLLYAQPATPCNLMQWYSEFSDYGMGYLAFDDFTNVGRNIMDLHWWGLSLRWNIDWVDCDPEGMTFEVKFYLDDGTGLPDYLNPVCTYTVAPTMAIVDYCPPPYHALWKFETDLCPCCLITHGWLSIQSLGSTNDCVFKWFSSPAGNGYSLVSDGSWPPAVNGFDLAFCLTGEPTVAPECGVASLYAQPAVWCPCTSWSAVTSDAGLGYLAFDSYSDVEVKICDVHWWGLSLRWNNGWVPDQPYGMEFEIKIYPDNGSGEPDVNNPVCTYTVVTYANDITEVYDCCEYPLWYPLWFFHVELETCCTLPEDGWISIQSISSPYDSAFLWFEGLPGDGQSLQDQDGSPPLEIIDFDLAFCFSCSTMRICKPCHARDVAKHCVETVARCLMPGEKRNDCVEGPPMFDPWITKGGTYHNFGAAGQAVPADFFGPGSDPFEGELCFYSVPLGPVDLTAYGFGIEEFGDADVLIWREDDPFDRCVIPPVFPTDVVEMEIEVIALSLGSTDPITVTYNGGQNPELWDVALSLSQTSTPPLGLLRATKTHCNGGTYQIDALQVQSLFTFTKVIYPTTELPFDTGLYGIAPVVLDLMGADTDYWVHDLDEALTTDNPICTDLHTGLEEAEQTTDCTDCNMNGILDDCDIAAGTSCDFNTNGIPDECEGGPTVCPGDSNCDTVINWRDIDYFVAAQNDNVAAWEAMFLPGTPSCPFANNDVNGDCTANWRDIDPFVALMNTTCP
ncbi:MAG: hypothetical protein KAY37_01870 [Phycisphaerae bacterium]|nr:hypothetical protein [Phycisphaerae bacterium]